MRAYRQGHPYDEPTWKLLESAGWLIEVHRPQAVCAVQRPIGGLAITAGAATVEEITAGELSYGQIIDPERAAYLAGLVNDGLHDDFVAATTRILTTIRPNLQVLSTAKDPESDPTYKEASHIRIAASGPHKLRVIIKETQLQGVTAVETAGYWQVSAHERGSLHPSHKLSALVVADTLQAVSCSTTRMPESTAQHDSQLDPNIAGLYELQQLLDQIPPLANPAP
jgi:hypothetical protein